MKDSANNTFYRFSEWLKKSVVVKMFSIGFLVLLLLIPNAMISDLIHERQERQAAVTSELSQSWGGFQSITGPVLSIPFSTWTTYETGNKKESQHIAWFLPKQLNIEGDLPHQVRQRSIFDVILYQADIRLEGSFEKPDFAALHVPPEDIHWEKAELTVGITGMTGIKELLRVNWNETSYEMEPGTPSQKIFRSGVSAPVPVNADSQDYTFSIPVKLNGSTGIRFEPVGKSTRVNLRSTWHSPGFTGAFLPDNREIGREGFSATWQVLDLNRSYPQQWIDDEVTFTYNAIPPGLESQYFDRTMTGQSDNSAVAVRMVQPVDEYLKNMRSAKYAILIIGMTFLLFFFFEVLQKLLIHPFQYLLVGLALTVFYLLLLSLSEHIGFNGAYTFSAVATVSLITGYSWSVLGARRMVLQLVIMLSAIYGFVFVLLQLEDYALLAGSFGVFLALAAVMYASRKINWYDLGQRGS